MDKLQKLLSLHKDKLWGGGFEHKIWERKIDNHSQIMIVHKYHIYQGRGEVQYSLSDLLFNTQFLSLLEWKPLDDGTEWVRYDEYESDRYMYNSDYHKINLCLLDNDSDRIKYLEDNVIIDD